MRTLKIFAALATLAMGCGTYDPCAGQSGTCVGLIADNLASGDVIHVSMTGAASTDFTQTLSGSAPFGIPVLVKSDASGQATITVEKMVGSSTMARGVTDVSFASGGHTLAMVEVKPVIGSNVGNPDMAKPPVCEVPPDVGTYNWTCRVELNSAGFPCQFVADPGSDGCFIKCEGSFSAPTKDIVMSDDKKSFTWWHYTCDRAR